MIQDKLAFFLEQVAGKKARLILVTKTHGVDTLQIAYNEGCRVFGENRVQELMPKYEALPKDIEWHLIGTLQSNKVRYIAPFISLIHSIDNPKLLEAVNKEALKNKRVIDCLLQIHIAQEETKHGFSYEEAENFLQSTDLPALSNVRIVGMMGMATFTTDEKQVRKEFQTLRLFMEHIQATIDLPNVKLKELSMGMSNDYYMALAEGSTMVRIGSAILGSR